MSNKTILTITAVMSFLSVTLNLNIFYGILSIAITFVLFEIMNKMEMNGSFKSIGNLFNEFVNAGSMDSKNKGVLIVFASVGIIALIVFMINAIFPCFITGPFCMLCMLKCFAYFTNRNKAF